MSEVHQVKHCPKDKQELFDTITLCNVNEYEEEKTKWWSDNHYISKKHLKF